MIIRVAVLLVVLASSSVQAQRREPDRWFGNDKVKHFISTGFAYGVSHAALQLARTPDGSLAPGAAIGAVIAGVGKEIVDRRRGSHICVKDLVWDAAGAVLVGIMMKHTRR